MTSLPLQFDVSSCNLGPINGLYKFSKQNCYIHTGGKYLLVKGTDNIWSITEGKDRHCFAQKASSSPCDVAWNYFSKAKLQIHASSMVVSRAAQTTTSPTKSPATGQTDGTKPTPIRTSPVKAGEVSAAPANGTRRKAASPVPPSKSPKAESAEDKPKTAESTKRKKPADSHAAPEKVAKSTASVDRPDATARRNAKPVKAPEPDPKPVIAAPIPDPKPVVVPPPPAPAVEESAPVPTPATLPVPLPVPPPLPVPEEPKENNICRYSFESANKTPFAVYAPIKCTAAAQKSHEEAVYHGTWEAIEPLWGSTVTNFENELRLTRATVEQHVAQQKHFIAEKKELQNTIHDLTSSLEDTKERFKAAEQRADNLISRVGKSHIKRDWQQTKLESAFPSGEDVRSEFMTALLNFESFAEDAVNCLEDLGHDDDAKEVLVRDVMTPFFNVLSGFLNDKLQAKKDVLLNLFGVAVNEDSAEDTVSKLFWYSTQQPQVPPEIEALSDADITALMEKAGTKLDELHQQMLTAEAQNMISSGDGTLRFPQLARILLRMLTISALSDPRCFLLPAPGVRLPYKEGFCSEVLSPGVKKHGRIKEGDTVEVVLPGLYFDNPHDDFATAKPAIPCLVRRL